MKLQTILYGASSNLASYLAFTKNTKNVILVDRSAKLWNEQINGLTVYPPHKIQEYDTSEADVIFLTLADLKTSIKSFVYFGIAENRMYVWSDIQKSKTSTGERKSSPAVVISSAPKTATVWIKRNLEQTLLSTHIPIHSNDWSSENNKLSEAQLFNLKRQNGFTVSHIYPSIQNQELINYCAEAFILNVREPRQVTISYMHHVLRVLKNYTPEKRLAYCRYHRIPQDFIDATNESVRITAFVQTYFDRYCNFMLGWMKAMDNTLKHLSCAVSKYEDIHGNAGKFNEIYCNAFGLSEGQLDFSRHPTEGRNNFRQANHFEWQQFEYAFGTLGSHNAFNEVCERAGYQV